MKQTAIVAIILGVLVLISLVQAFQLNELKKKVAEGQFNVKTASSKAPDLSSENTKKSTAALPSNVKNLPQMVGGC